MQKDCFNRIQINWTSNKNNGNHRSNLLSVLMKVSGSILLKNLNTKTFFLETIHAIMQKNIRIIYLFWLLGFFKTKTCLILQLFCISFRCRPQHTSTMFMLFGLFWHKHKILPLHVNKGALLRYKRDYINLQEFLRAGKIWV